MKARTLFVIVAPLAAACGHGADTPAVVPVPDAGTEAMSNVETTPPAARKASFDADQKAASALNPSDLHFAITLASCPGPAPARFFAGEPITVTLTFSSDTPKKYRLDKGLYDRSGRMTTEDWILDRSDTVDPLVDYFASGFMSLGGVRQMPILDTKPETVTFALNEWHRFDHPGHYRLYVTSHRIESEGPDGKRLGFAPTSNVIEFDVVPLGPDDAARLLTEAVKLADSTKDDERRDGQRRLRFLGTEPALDEMIRRFTDDLSSTELEFGIVGSPHRATALAHMELRLADDVAIPTRFLGTLALLRDRVDAPTAKWDAAARQALVVAYAGKLAAALGGRSATNRAISTATVLDVAWTVADPAKPEPAWLGGVLASLPSVFRDLPAAQQMNVLGYRWKRARDPALAPALRDVYDDPKSTPDQREAALHRLIELDPAGAKLRILDRLRTGQPALGVFAPRSLHALPDATLPALDGALATRLEADPTAAGDVARYATAAIAPRVKRVYAARAGTFASDVEGELVGYFLRVDPAYGEKIAAALVAAHRSGTPGALKKAADRAWTPGLEKVLVGALASPDSDLVATAAELLSAHGSVAAQAPLWKRLEDFHTTWSGRESELAYSITGGFKNDAVVRLETALWRALVNARGWLADRAAVARAQSLVVRPSEKEQVGYTLRTWDAALPLELTRGDDMEWRGRVAQYEVKSPADLDAKLAQLPKGTTLRFGPVDPSEKARLTTKLAALGLKLLP
jgi:hypothetical protein